MRSDAEANRREILGAAGRLIAEQGLGVSMRTIAQAAGVGIGTLYRHFATREDLLIGLANSILDDVGAAAERFHESQGSLEARWRGYVLSLVNLNVGALAGSLRTETHLRETDPFVQRRERTMSGIGTVLQVVRDHDLVAADVTVSRFLVGIIQFTRPLPADAPTDFNGETAWLLDVYLGGLRSPNRASAGLFSGQAAGTL